MRTALPMLTLIIGLVFGFGSSTIYWSQQMDQQFAAQRQWKAIADKQGATIQEQRAVMQKQDAALVNLTAATGRLIEATKH